MIAAGAREESNQAQPTNERPDHDGRIDAITPIETPLPAAPIQLDADDIRILQGA